jgi:eukaryotic-like serine/threonine-protein kinase
MTPERWKQIQENLDIAIALIPPERESFLQQLGNTDLELQQELQSLLACQSAAPEFLWTSALRSVAPVAWPKPKRMPLLDRMLGPYRLTELLGTGGMGDVYRAVRADGQYDQKVALKIVRSDFGGELTARFRNERQILASFDHPNIARILDGSTTENGIPYLVMELIEGHPITDYCDQHNLSIDERLKLFRTVCAAVHYAHQHLVVHRDIKPGNILVTDDGTPKLLDFGIAKILASDSVERNGTRTGLLLMTPEYASPEQLRGEPITTTTDVYSLGLILYELLTGCHPFRARGNIPHEIARGVLEMEPERPSGALRRKSTAKEQSATPLGLGNASVSPDKLSRRLSGDLDSIVLKALRKEPRDRYSSVDQLSEDIRRHLEGLPVSAREGTLSYRASKYVLRHKVGVASVGLIFLMLVTGLTVTLREARIAQRNELRAERRFNDVRKLANSLLFEIHDSVRDLPGSTPARKLIVENALHYLDSLSSEAGGDPSLQRELATAYERVGEVQGHYLLSNLGETTNALHSYQKALRLRQDLSASRDSSWQDQLALARCYRLVTVQLQAMGKIQDAAENIKEAIALTESVRKDHPQEIGILEELSSDYEINGHVYGGGGVSPGLVDAQTNSESRRKAMAVDEDWVKMAPSSEEAQHALAWDQMEYAGTLGPDHRDEALHYLGRSLAIAKQIAAHSNSIKRARDVAVVYNHMGMFYNGGGDYAKSLECHQNAVQIYQDLVRQDPQNKLLTQGLAVAHTNVADVLAKMGRVSESKSQLASAIDLMENLVRTNPDNASQQMIMAEMHRTRAQILRRSRDPAASLEDYKIALTVFRKVLERDKSNTSAQLKTATCSVGMAKAEMQLDLAESASSDFRAALEAVKPLVSSDRLDPRAFYTAADIYAGLGRLEAAHALHASPVNVKPHREAARNWFRLSLENLSKVSQPMASFDDDIGPIDSAQIGEELSHFETALRHVRDQGLQTRD